MGNASSSSGGGTTAGGGGNLADPSTLEGAISLLQESRARIYNLENLFTGLDSSQVKTILAQLPQVFDRLGLIEKSQSDLIADYNAFKKQINTLSPVSMAAVQSLISAEHSYVDSSIAYALTHMDSRTDYGVGYLPQDVKQLQYEGTGYSFERGILQTDPDMVAWGHPLILQKPGLYLVRLSMLINGPIASGYSGFGVRDVSGHTIGQDTIVYASGVPLYYTRPYLVKVTDKTSLYIGCTYSGSDTPSGGGAAVDQIVHGDSFVEVFRLSTTAPP